MLSLAWDITLAAAGYRTPCALPSEALPRSALLPYATPPTGLEGSRAGSFCRKPFLTAIPRPLDAAPWCGPATHDERFRPTFPRAAKAGAAEGGAAFATVARSERQRTLCAILARRSTRVREPAKGSGLSVRFATRLTRLRRRMYSGCP